jgi:hypothetical protein
MTGTDKRWSVIGKLHKPHCFKNVQQYAANKKAWMSSNIFQQ